MTEGHKRNLAEGFEEHKQQKFIATDTGGVIEGLHAQNLLHEVTEFERSHPGISEEFTVLMEMLPDADMGDPTEFPIAASVVSYVDGQLQVLARSTNAVNARGDSTQHAEMVAIQEAQKKRGKKHLEGCMLLSTVQPCLMCSGAITHTEIKQLVYGVSQQDLRGKHVEFRGSYKPFRTTPSSIDTDAALSEAGVEIIAGYKHDEVMEKLDRMIVTFTEYYQDPDA